MLIIVYYIYDKKSRGKVAFPAFFLYGVGNKRVGEIVVFVNKKDPQFYNTSRQNEGPFCYFAGK